MIVDDILGTPVVVDFRSGCRAVACGCFVKFGSVSKEKNIGLAHFIEHVVFDELQEIEEFAELGVVINAYTTKDYTSYTFITTDEYFDKVFPIFFKKLLSSEFSSKAIESVRRVILRERSSTDDKICVEELMRLLYGGQSIGKPIVGLDEEIGAITESDIQAVFSEYYNAKNMAISVVGGITFECVSDILSRLIPMQKSLAYKSEYTPATVCIYGGKSYLSKPIDQVHYCCGWNAPSVLDKYYFETIVFTTFISCGANSDLYKSIRQKLGIAYYFSAKYFAYLHCGTIIIYGITDKENCKQLSDEIKNIISHRLKIGIDEIELHNAKELLKNQIIINDANIISAMDSYGKSLLLLGRVRSLEERIADIIKVKSANINIFMNKYIDMEKMSEVYYGTNEMA